MVTVGVAAMVVVTVVVEVVEAALRAKDPVKGVEPRPPEAVTIATARRTPATSPIPKRFPSIVMCPP